MAVAISIQISAEEASSCNRVTPNYLMVFFSPRGSLFMAILSLMLSTLFTITFGVFELAFILHELSLVTSLFVLLRACFYYFPLDQCCLQPEIEVWST